MSGSVLRVDNAMAPKTEGNQVGRIIIRLREVDVMDMQGTPNFLSRRATPTTAVSVPLADKSLEPAVEGRHIGQKISAAVPGVISGTCIRFGDAPPNFLCVRVPVERVVRATHIARADKSCDTLARCRTHLPATPLVYPAVLFEARGGTLRDFVTRKFLADMDFPCPWVGKAFVPRNLAAAELAARRVMTVRIRGGLPVRVDRRDQRAAAALARHFGQRLNSRALLGAVPSLPLHGRHSHALMLPHRQLRAKGGGSYFLH